MNESKREQEVGIENVIEEKKHTHTHSWKRPRARKSAMME